MIKDWIMQAGIIYWHYKGIDGLDYYIKLQITIQTYPFEETIPHNTSLPVVDEIFLKYFTYNLHHLLRFIG